MTCKWLITLVIASPHPIPFVVGPLPNGLFMDYKWGVILTSCDTWDDPPSIVYNLLLQIAHWLVVEPTHPKNILVKLEIHPYFKEIQVGESSIIIIYPSIGNPS